MGQGIAVARTYQLINQVFTEESLADEDEDNFKFSLTLAPYSEVSKYSKAFLSRAFFEEGWLGTQHFDIDTLLSATDFAHMQKQLAQPDVLTVLDKKRLHLKRKRLVKKHKPPKKIRLGGFSHYRITRPLFSVDGKTALIYIEEYCGIECGSGLLSICQLNDEQV